MNIAQELLELYKGLERAHGKFIITERKGDKVKGRATTIIAPVTVELWEQHLTGEQGLGIVPIRDDSMCHFGAIDIDDYNVKISDIEKKVASFGLPLIPCTTKSGGVHLYLFSKEGVPAKLLRDCLTEWAGGLGFPGIEIFPKQIQLASDKDVGNWINMPYFNVNETNRYGIYKGNQLLAEDFIKRAKKLYVTEDILDKIVIPVVDGMEGAPPCISTLCRAGFPEGSRNNALFNLGVYARMRFMDDWETKIDEYNRKYMNPGSAQEVVNIIKSLKKKTYFYKCNEQPLCNYCNKTVCRQREFGVGQSDEEWNITIDTDCQKILTDPPYWVISIEGVRLELTSQDLMSQQKFRLKCIEKINKVPSKVKSTDWDKMVQTILDTAEEVEAPQDAGSQGQLIFLLEQFCTQRAQARVMEELLSGKPWTDEERTYFRSGDFIKYLDQQHFRELNRTQIYAALRNAGVTHHQLNKGKKCIQCWSVAEFAHDMKPLPVHKIDEGDSM